MRSPATARNRMLDGKSRRRGGELSLIPVQVDRVPLMASHRRCMACWDRRHEEQRRIYFSLQSPSRLVPARVANRILFDASRPYSLLTVAANGCK
jgi:hypothetical protein